MHLIICLGGFLHPNLLTVKGPFQSSVSLHVANLTSELKRIIILKRVLYIFFIFYFLCDIVIEINELGTHQSLVGKSVF